MIMEALNHKSYLEFPVLKGSKNYFYTMHKEE